MLRLRVGAPAQLQGRAARPNQRGFVPGVSFPEAPTPKMTRSSAGTVPAGLRLYCFDYPPRPSDWPPLPPDAQPEQVFLSCDTMADQVALQHGAISYTSVLSGRTVRI